MKKNLIFVFALCVFSFCSFSAFSVSSVQKANRRTAVRCLNLAKNYLSSGDFENALSQTELGLSYDETVSDLWYIKAAAMNQKGEARAFLIPLVQRAVTEGEWVDYNRDSARILYADLLCDTGEYVQALAVLDSNPRIYNSDSEFIRAKSYYRIGTEDSVSKAREKINSARKIYGKDMRFPELFFRHEYSIMKRDSENAGNSESAEKPAENTNGEDFSDEASSVLVRKIADSFIAGMPEYENPDAELEIYAAIFASGERQRRLLEAFSSHGLRHPLFAGIALENGLLTEGEAWDYFSSFADGKISLSLLEDFLKHITDEEISESVREYLNAYSGTLTLDTNGDLEENLTVIYSRGRPESFFWDSTNDGIIEWNVKCDFGVPETIDLTDGNIRISYGTYPGIVKALYKSARYENGAAVFNILDGEMRWSPFDIKIHALIKDLFDFDFYVPFPEENSSHLDAGLFLSSCYSYEVPTEERENSFIRFSVLDGQIQGSEYIQDGRLYASGTFVNSLPEMRSVDNDGDGVFETTEYFGFDPENEYETSLADQEQIMTNLFGLPASGSGLFVRMIQIDRNKDAVPDFSEEYLPLGGKITSWDNDYDGNWEIRYKKYPQENGSPLVEESEFLSFFEKQIVKITSLDGVPSGVSVGGTDYEVTKGSYDGFYWIGEHGGAEDEYSLLKDFDFSAPQGTSMLLENDSERMIAVKIGGNVYGTILPSSETDFSGTDTTESDSSSADSDDYSSAEGETNP